jgi:hypothetical protein
VNSIVRDGQLDTPDVVRSAKRAVLATRSETRSERWPELPVAAIRVDVRTREIGRPLRGIDRLERRVFRWALPSKSPIFAARSQSDGDLDNISTLWYRLTRHRCQRWKRSKNRGDARVHDIEIFY